MKKWLFLGAGVILLSGCGLFSSNSSLTPNQQMAAFIAHEHRMNSGETALKSNSGNNGKTKADIYTSLGVAYLQNGHPRQAVRELQRAIGEDDNDADAYNVMGLAYEQLGQRKQARKAFTQALAIDGNNPEYLNNYGAFLVHVGAYREAVRQLKRATADPLYNTPQFAWTNLAQAYAGLKNLTAARRALEHALYLVPNYPPALEMLAEIDFHEGDVDAAYQHLQVVLAQQPNNADALLLAGRIAARRGQTGEAREFWQRCINADPYSTAGKKAQQFLLQKQN